MHEPLFSCTKEEIFPSRINAIFLLKTIMEHNTIPPCKKRKCHNVYKN